MNLIVHLKQLWQNRLLVAAATLLALAISVGAVYRVSLLPPALGERTVVAAEGSIEILVDSASSPIADARRDLEGLTARAGVFAEMMTGGRVVGRMARESGISAKQIDVTGPQPLPGEAPGAEGDPARAYPYELSIAQQFELPIVAVLTRAPTAPEARALAAAAPVAIAELVESIQARQRTPPRKQVEFRPLGPAEVAPVDDALGIKAALALFVGLLGSFLVLILLLPRIRDAWREAGAEPEPATTKPTPLLLYTDVGDPELAARRAEREREREQT